MIFRRKKYQYNPVTLVFEEIKIDRKHRIKEVFSYIFIALSLTFISGYLLNQLFGSQESRVLENQVVMLNQKLQLLVNKGHNFSTSLRKDIFVKDNSYRTILQIDTLPGSFRAAGFGGSATDIKIDMQDDLSYQVYIIIDKLNHQLQIQSGSYKTLYDKALSYSARLNHLPAIQPIAQKDLIMISSDFGIRTDPFLFIKQFHNGLDFVAGVGKNVYATGDGIVTFLTHSRKGYGNEIVINHAFGFESRYGHLNTIKVKEGEKIKRGQNIGTVGATGRATGPHLHYEVLYEHKPVNPSFYFDNTLTKDEYAQILNKANKDIN